MGRAKKPIIVGFGLAVLLGLASLLVIKLYRKISPAVVSSERVIKGKLILPPHLENSVGSEVNFEIILPKNQESEPSRNLPVFLTGIFTLLGSAMALVFSQIVNSATRKFEWAKHFWETYQESYVDLRNIISQTTDANLIERKINALGSHLFLPLQIEKSLKELLDFLRSSASSQAKEERVAAFLQTFEAFMLRPWKHL